jgi:cytidylate kinase
VVITLSREAESGGEQIARLVSEGAGLQLADRAILGRISQQTGLPIAQLAAFDELMPGPIEGVIVEWRTSASHDLYVRRLVDALMALEREDDVLIMGRGAAFVLTDPGTAHLRVVAPMPCRVARLVERTRMPRSRAQRLLRQSDAARAHFVRRAFDADIGAACHYDLVIDTAELTLEDAAELALLAARRKSARRSIPKESAERLVSHVLRFRRRPRFPRVSEAVWRNWDRRSREIRF